MQEGNKLFNKRKDAVLFRHRLGNEHLCGTWFCAALCSVETCDIDILMNKWLGAGRHADKAHGLFFGSLHSSVQQTAAFGKPSMLDGS